MTHPESGRYRQKDTAVSVAATLGLCGSIALAVYLGGQESEVRDIYGQHLAAALSADGFRVVPEAFSNDADGRPTADLVVGACALKDVRLTYEGDGQRPFNITDYHFEAYVAPYTKPAKQLDPFISGGEITLDFRNDDDLRGMVGDACAELEPILGRRDIRTVP